MKAVGEHKVFGEHDFISSCERPDKSLSRQIQFLPVAGLFLVSDKCEFDMTLSMSNVTERLACVCVRLCINSGAEVCRKKMEKQNCRSIVDNDKQKGRKNKKKVAIAKPSYDFTNWGQRGHREGLAEEEGNERCFMALSCRQTEP